MTNLYRVRSRWTGFPGGPGVATHYFLDVDTAVASLAAFWEAIKAKIPAAVQITVDPVGDIIDDATGDLVSAWAATPVGAIQCTGSGVYAAGVGGQVRWDTNTILDGHRLRGRTFLVPMSSGGGYDNNGTLDDNCVGAFYTAAQNLVTAQSASMVVWHRPRAASPAGVSPAVSARAGGHGLVTMHRVPDKVAMLRTRRD